MSEFRSIFPHIINHENNVIGYERTLTDKAFSKFIFNDKIKSLNIEYCLNLTPKTLGYFTQCTNLESLNISNTNMLDGLPLISFYFKKLSYLNLKAINIPDTFLSTLCLDNLRIINLAYCYSISDVTLLELSKCLYLEGLILRSNQNISDIGLSEILRNCRKLKICKLSYCTNLTSESLSLIGNYLEDLEFINLSGCNVTNEVLIKIMKNCSKLKILKIANCNEITNESILYIIESSNILEDICINGCKNISDDVYEELMIMIILRKTII